MLNRNKLLLPYKDETILTHTIGNILKAGIGELIVVTGYEESLIMGAVRQLPVRTVYNPDYEQGMTSSIRTGVRAATTDSHATQVPTVDNPGSGADHNLNGYMICLGDMVRITVKEYALLHQAFEDKVRSNAHCICQPIFNGQPGNPVIFSAAYRDTILQHREKDGCKGIIAAHADHVSLIDMPFDHILRDVDHPDEYSSLLEEK
jgi:molybdenum cofactor cytidylyltransferase